ncbi:MAG: hypothetical protein GF355_15820, partial [Candidatus Eisenbacteria bacterium]|nr:hypothetical protein [Candidatus Eisenbacteria bacterium]
MKGRFAMRQRWLSVLIQVSLIACGSAASGVGVASAELEIAVIGDRTGGHTPGIYEKILTTAVGMDPDLVITVGDMIEGYTEDAAVIEERWRGYRALLEPIDVPIHFVAGNNDIWSDLSDSLYRRHIGQPNVSFDHGGYHFVRLTLNESGIEAAPVTIEGEVRPWDEVA